MKEGVVRRFRFLMVAVLSASVLGIGAEPLRADDVIVAVSLHKPPYVIQEEKAGIEYDIVREALAYKGHRLIPRFMPQRRILYEYQHGMVGGIYSVKPFDNLKGYVTDPTVVYHNFAVTLASSKLQISSFADLAGKTVVSFQNAKHFLGAEFSAAISQADAYTEVRNQFSQAKMLLSERVQVAIGDKAIIQYFAKRVAPRFRQGKELVFHSIMKPNPYHSAFWEERIRDDFNEGLSHLRASGRYDEILEKYTDY